MKKVVFAGTPEFAVPSLAALCDDPNVDVVAVYTQPDRPVGRGRKILPGPVKQFALDRGLVVLQPDALDTDEAFAQFCALKADLMVVVAYGQLLRQRWLSAPEFGCVNLHASLLPRWRGAAPIQRAIEAGDAKTGVALMQMTRKLDAGDVLASVDIDIAPHDTSAALHDCLSQMAGKLLTQSLVGIFDHSLKPVAQAVEGITYAHKIDKQEAAIDWSQSADKIANKVRAFNPWPVTFTVFNGRPLRIFMARALPDTSELSPGTVMAVDDGIQVQTGQGSLLIEQLQKSGGKMMSSRDFLAGNHLAVGDQLDARVCN